MNPKHAAELLAHIANLGARVPDPSPDTARAWAAALPDVELTEARVIATDHVKAFGACTVHNIANTIAERRRETARVITLDEVRSRRARRNAIERGELTPPAPRDDRALEQLHAESLTVACRWCAQPAGQRCVVPRGATAGDPARLPHAGRSGDARRAAAEAPSATDAGEGA